MAAEMDDAVEVDYGDDPITMRDEEEEKPKILTKKTKGRGHKGSGGDDAFGRRGGSKFDTLSESSREGALKSCEGWVIFVSGVHEESQEDDLYERFSEHGEIQQINLNLNRQTGFVKGYTLIEYKSFEEASRAIQNEDGSTFHRQKLRCSFAFSKHAIKGR